MSKSPFFTELDLVSIASLSEYFDGCEQPFSPSHLYVTAEEQNLIDENQRKREFRAIKDEKLFQLTQPFVDRLNEKDGSSTYTLLRNDVTHIKYQKGGFFKRHFDYLSLTSNFVEEYSMLICVTPQALLHHEQGGRTVLHINNTQHVSNATTTPGASLTFRKDVEHEGTPVLAGEKHIIMINLIATRNNSQRMVVIRFPERNEHLCDDVQTLEDGDRQYNDNSDQPTPTGKHNNVDFDNNTNNTNDTNHHHPDDDDNNHDDDDDDDGDDNDDTDNDDDDDDYHTDDTNNDNDIDTATTKNKVDDGELNLRKLASEKSWIIPIQEILAFEDSLLAGWVRFQDTTSVGDKPPAVLEYLCNDCTFDEFGVIYRVMKRMHVSAEEFGQHWSLIDFFGFPRNHILVELSAANEESGDILEVPQEGLAARMSGFDEGLIITPTQERARLVSEAAVAMSLPFVPFRLIMVEGNLDIQGDTGRPGNYTFKMDPVWLSLGHYDNVFGHVTLNGLLLMHARKYESKLNT